MPVCPLQMLVELAVMVEGWDTLPTVTDSVRAVLLPPQLSAVTLTLPPAEPAVAVMLLVPCPEVIVQPAGTVHV